MKVLLAALTLAVLAGCGSVAETPITPPTPVPTPPQPDSCYQLSNDAAARAHASAASVGCQQPHNSRSIHVGQLRLAADGHLLAVDSDRVQQRAANTCTNQLQRHLDASAETIRMSQFEVLWFGPTPSEAKAGAAWFRCDLVAFGPGGKLLDLPRQTEGLLAQPDALDDWGTCGTTAPDQPRFERVPCAAQHQWRVRSVIELPADTAHLDTAAGEVADDECRDVVALVAKDPLTLTWSVEWPTETQWDAGVRTALCWSPDPA